MTRKDFNLLAACLLEIKQDEDAGTPASARLTASRFASVLKATNPRFDRERFMRACGHE